MKEGLLARNPADAATPPSAREAKAPEMACWTAAQLAAFLAWSAENSQHHALWRTLAYTGMRRGEALSLRWRDIDLDAGTVRVRRSAGIVRIAGEGAQMVEDDTKSGKPRVIGIDPATSWVLRSWKSARGRLAQRLVKPDALVFGDLEDAHRNGEHVWRQFVGDVRQCRKAAGADVLPAIPVHGLRHTHATILLLAGAPVHVVSQRLGHASAVVTMTTYAHVLPGNDQDAVTMFASEIEKAEAA